MREKLCIPKLRFWQGVVFLLAAGAVGIILGKFI
jgi:hypothetical protein